MKRILSLLLCAALLLCLAPAAFAAGSASLSGPQVVRAGDTITLTFYAGGGIYGGSGSLAYDANQLTLQSWSQSIGGTWAVEFSGSRFVFYDNSMANPIESTSAIFQATFTVNAALPAETAISVIASGITLSDGKQDTSAGSCTYAVTLAKPLSDNADLSSLTLGNATLSPAFSPNVTSYSVSVPYSVSSLELSAAAADGGAKVSISNPNLIAAAITVVSVTVTAENNTTKTYTISVTRAQDPNYTKSSNAALKSLSVDGYALSPAFDPDVTQYYIWLPYEAETFTCKAEPADQKASVEAGQSPVLTPGEALSVPVTVTAEDGAQKIYTINAFRAPSHENIGSFLEHLKKPIQDSEPTEAPTEPTQPQETTPPETTAPPTTAPTAPPTTAPTQPTVSDTQPEPASSRSLIILYILGCIICLSAGSIGGMLLATAIHNKKMKKRKSY